MLSQIKNSIVTMYGKNKDHKIKKAMAQHDFAKNCDSKMQLPLPVLKKIK